MIAGAQDAISFPGPFLPTFSRRGGRGEGPGNDVPQDAGNVDLHSAIFQFFTAKHALRTF